jgi:hypothetical protein
MPYRRLWRGRRDRAALRLQQAASRSKHRAVLRTKRSVLGVRREAKTAMDSVLPQRTVGGTDVAARGCDAFPAAARSYSVPR